MSKPTFEKVKQSRRDRCLEIAARLKRKNPDAIVTPTLVTRACLKEKDFFTQEELEGFQFQMARRLVEQWMKTLDEKGLQTWGQLPLVTAEGEMVWERRVDMKIDGYAWNYLLRDDVAVKNQIIRDRWRDEAVQRWGTVKFDAEIERLRQERAEPAGAA